jgi:hypothetical protein
VTEENRLDFEATVRLARQHIELVDQYKAVWELLQGESGGEGFLRSRIWLKAQMAMLRALLLSGCSEYLSDEADRLFDNLMNLVDHKSDRNRLDNYRVWADVRSHRWEIALARANKLLDSDDGLYSAQFAARAAADAVLHNREQFRQEAAQILTILRKRVNVGVGHPQDLIWRDVGVLEYCVGDGKKAAIKCMRSCLAATKGLASGPVASWIRLLADIHMETFTGRNGFVAELPSAASALQSQAEELARSTDRLLAYRMVSPF